MISRSDEVLDGLFFGHEKTAVFGERSERILSGLAGEAAIAIDDARSFQTAQHEREQRRHAEAALQELNLHWSSRSPSARRIETIYGACQPKSCWSPASMRRTSP